MRIFLVFLAIFFISCAKEKDSVRKNSNPPVYEGWHGAPESIDKKPFDFYYLFQKGVVKSKSVKPDKMEKACVDSVRVNGFPNIISSLVLDALRPVSDVTETFEKDSINFILRDVRKKKLKIETKDCQPTSPNFDWKECECVTYIYIPDGKDYIVKTMQELE